jgi:putative hydrolase of the HAD superfamily
MARLAPVKAILFDFGGTLDADGVAWKERFHAAYRDEGLMLEEEAFARHFYAADDPLIGGLAETAGLDETAQRLTANLEASFAALEATAVNPDRGRRVAARFAADARAALKRSAAAMAGLARRYRLGVVSNFYGNLVAVCRDTGLDPYLGSMIDSQQLGIEKPAPEIFQAALRQLGAQPEETAFVGDSLRRDREGARNAGLHFIWVAPPSIRGAAGTLDHAVVASIAEVAELLE